MEILTKHGHNFYNVTSLMQKAIRRGDYELATKAAGEIYTIFPLYTCNRVPIILTEDCDGNLAHIIMPKIKEILTNDKLIKKLKKNELENELQIEKLWNKGKKINNEIMYILAKSTKNRDVDFFIHFDLKRKGNVYNIKLRHDFDKDVDYLNYLTNQAWKNQNNPKVIGYILFLVYTMNTPSQTQNKITLQYMNIIINFLSEKIPHLSEEDKLEISALQEMHYHKYMKIKLAERHTAYDDSIYILIRIAFVLAGMYTEAENQDNIDCELINIDDMYLKSSFVFPEYTFDKHTGQKISHADFTIREYKATPNINNRIYNIETLDLNDILTKPMLDYWQK